MRAQRYVWVVALGVMLSSSLWALGQQPASAGSAIGQPTPPTTQPSAAKGPRLEIDKDVFDFGRVWEGKPAKGTFTVRNVGDAALTLATKSSCGCTVASKPKSPLPPGESTTFTISYSTKRLGQARKKVTVSTNDPTRPSVEIPVRGEVRALFAGDPSNRVTFKALDGDSVESRTVKLTNQYGQPLNLKLREGQNYGPFDVSLKSIKPGMEYELTVTTKPPLNTGYNNSKVILETGAEEVPALTVQISARVPPRIVAIPSRVLVPSTATRPLTRAVRIEYRTNPPLTIKEVKSSLASLEYELIPPTEEAASEKLASYILRLTVPAYQDLPDDGATLEIITDDKSEAYRRLRVPVVKHVNRMPALRARRTSSDLPVNAPSTLGPSTVK